MTQFIQSTSGRLMSFSIATALIGAGASALTHSLFVDKAEAAPERQMMAKPAHAMER